MKLTTPRGRGGRGAATTSDGDDGDRQNSSIGPPLQPHDPAVTSLDIASALSLLQDTKDWKPSPGDRLIGILEGAVPSVGPFGHGAQLIIRDTNGVQWRLWLTGFIRAQLAAYKASIGDEVGILFQGKGVGASGKSFNRYQIVVRKVVGSNSTPLLATIEDGVIQGGV